MSWIEFMYTILIMYCFFDNAAKKNMQQQQNAITTRQNENFIGQSLTNFPSAKKQHHVHTHT